MKMIQAYNNSTESWENVFNSPLSDLEAPIEIKKLRKWAKEDGSGMKYRIKKLYLVSA